MDAARLISQVYIRSSLWDQQDRQYTNRRFTDQLWDEVAREMRSSKQAIKSKWKNLRDAYRKEFKKSQAENSNDPGISHWAHFKQMSFVKDQMFPAHGPTENSTQSTCSDYVECRDRAGEETNYQNCHWLSANIDDHLSMLQKRQRMVNAETDLDDGEQRKMNGFDEDEYFFSSLIPSLKVLPLAEKLSLRSNIQQLILVHIRRYENALCTPHGCEDIVDHEECVIKTEMIDIPDFSDNIGVLEDQESVINNMGELQNDSEILPPETNISANIVEQNAEMGETVKGRDEYDIWGEYVACKLRKLPNARVRCIAQHLINNVIFRAEMGKFDKATLHK